MNATSTSGSSSPKGPQSKNTSILINYKTQTWKKNQLFFSFTRQNWVVKQLQWDSELALSAEPEARMNSLYGLKDRQLTSAVWASTAWLGLEVLLDRVSQLCQEEIKNNPYKKTILQSSRTASLVLVEIIFNSRVWTAHIMSFWSSATDPKSDSWRRCQETSSTTAVWPVKMVFASTIFPSLGTALMSHRQIVYK